MKKISNQFVVNTVEDGESAPYYFQEWYAWSNDATTASVTTEPTIDGVWATSIPAQGSYAYLWRKSIRNVWDADSRTYTQETAQYFRMSGENGTSINVKGTIEYAYNSRSGFPTPSSSITGYRAIAKEDNRIWICQQVAQNAYDWVPNGGTASDGFSYTVGEGNFSGTSQSTSNLTGHLVMWSTEAADWVDLGLFKGEAGVTYYTHIAWATAVTLSNTQLPIPSGQTNRPNALAANISGFSITPLSGVSYAWMGYLIDTNSSDSQVKQNYTWEKNKGEKGDDASEVNPNILLRTIFDDGIDKVKEAWSSDWTVTSIDAATDTVVQGRKSLRINMANGQTEYCDLFQVIFGKLKASTWYTVSFNYFATQAWNTFLHSNVSSYPAYYDASAGIIIDGVMQTMSENNGTWQWPADWTGKRHTMTFKTASDISGIWNNSQLLFRVPQGCQLALCMPKLEIGQVATAYMANEGDLRGEKGDKGDIGRFFYFGGVWEDIASTDSFVLNDAQAPYFEHTVSGQKRYHVYNPENSPSGGTITKSVMAQTSFSNAPWEAMTNDFKYIITEALFSSYAHLGSWIFNGDYMLSQTGVDGTENYTQFTGEGSTWQPNLYMNAKTGKLVANSGVIGGFNINTSQIKSSNNNIILNSNGSATIGGFEIATDGKARLKSTLTVGNATSQRIEIIPFLSGTYGSQAIEFVKSGTGVSKVVVMELGFTNDNYGYFQMSKPATYQDVIDKYMSLSVGSMLFRYENTDNAALGSIDIKTESNGAFSQFCYEEPGELEKRFECGIRNKTINLRAYKLNGDSAWPEYSYASDPSLLDKGSVQVMSLYSLRQLFSNPSGLSDRLTKLSVLIIRNNATY